MKPLCQITTTFILFVVACCSAFLTTAQSTPQLLKDIHAANTYPTGVSNLYFGALFNDRYYFNVMNATNQDYSIWSTDGTDTGTHLLKNMTMVSNMVVYNGALYFGQIDPVLGSSLYKSDGTPSGTSILESFGGIYNAPTSFNIVNGKLFFVASATGGGTSRQLFVSDGTVAGTHVVDPTLYQVDFSFAQLNNRLFFSAAPSIDSSNFRELYSTDGNTATLVKDIRPGTSGSKPSAMLNIGNSIVFAANDGTHGTEMWRTDGTDAGTVLIKDINPGAAGMHTNVPNIGLYNGKAYFGATDGIDGLELWVTDGTSAGTSLVSNIRSGNLGSNPGSFVAFASRLFFVAQDDISGWEVWSTNGTAAGTIQLKDINPGSSAGVYALVSGNVMCNERLYFDAQDSGNNIEPWATDGTTSGTHKIDEVNPGAAGSLDFETKYVRLKDRVLFKAFNATYGLEIFYTNDTCNPTKINKLALSQQEVTVYPNPAQERITIDWPSTKQPIIATLTNMMGQLVLQQALNGKREMNLQSLPKGIYTLVLESDGKRVQQKLLIE